MHFKNNREPKAQIPVYDENTKEKIGNISIAECYADLAEHDRWYATDDDTAYARFELLGTVLIVPLDAVMHARSYEGGILCDRILRKDCPACARDDDSGPH